MTSTPQPDSTYELSEGDCCRLAFAKDYTARTTLAYRQSLRADKEVQTKQPRPVAKQKDVQTSVQAAFEWEDATNTARKNTARRRQDKSGVPMTSSEEATVRHPTRPAPPGKEGNSANQCTRQEVAARLQAAEQRRK